MSTKQAYETNADIPLPILKDTLKRNITAPWKTPSLISNEGQEGTKGLIETLLLQTLGAGSGGFAGHKIVKHVANRTKSPLQYDLFSKNITPRNYKYPFIAKNKKPIGAIATLLGSVLGYGTGGAVSQGFHNAESRDQFVRAMKGSLSAEDMRKVPKGLINLLDEGEAFKFMEMLPEAAPEIAKRPYVQQLFKSQQPI